MDHGAQFLIFLLLPTLGQTFFGLSSRWSIPDPGSPLGPTFTCESALSSRQRRLQRLCRRHLTETLTEALRLSAAWCRRHFEHERWNCSLDNTRILILRAGFRETAYLWSSSSAWVTHSVSRACSSGSLPSLCTCDDSGPDPEETRRAWLWGGCGDNARAGGRLARRLLGRRRRRRRTTNDFGKKRTPKFLFTSGEVREGHRDLLAKLESHNARIGLKVLRSGIRRPCKCHGVSGSCSVRTCWPQVPPPAETASALRRLYDCAVAVDDNRATAPGLLFSAAKGLHNNKQNSDVEEDIQQNTIYLSSPWSSDWHHEPQRHHQEQHHQLQKQSLLYLQQSPSFCESSRFGPGTRGRACRNSAHCETLCCGRGHNIRPRVLSRPCQCKVNWCCAVHCQMCTTSSEERICYF